jgi:DNA-binding GntR family transcriptional regulator
MPFETLLTAPAAAPDGLPIQARVCALIKAMIEDGRIRPGEKLLEVHVARAFGVSRSPARHALEALKTEKILRVAPGRGYIVAGHGAAADSGELAQLEEVAIQPMPRWERVHAELEKQVCTCVLYHSIRITEERVAEHFQVSRTVARDALARLHSAGVVSKDRQGRWVAPRVTPARIHDLYELRWMLEPVALVQSARMIGHDRIKQMREKLESTINDVEFIHTETHGEVEHDMHIELLSACPNREMMNVLERTHLLLISNPYLFNFYVGVSRADLKDSLQQHLQVFNLLLQDDWEGAAHALCQHLHDACTTFLKRFEAVASQPASPMPPYMSEVETGTDESLNDKPERPRLA